MKPTKTLFLMTLFIFLFSLFIGCSSPTSSDDPPPPSSLSYTGKTLPAGLMGFPYEQNLASATGASGISYTIASGSTLPAGFSLSSGGMLTGTPNAVAANAKFSVTASATGYTSATADFSFSIDFLAMVSIPGGTFMMGSPAGEYNRYSGSEAQHSAEISDFEMSIYPITQAQFERIMGFNLSYHQGAALPAGLANGDKLPVEMVTWFDAVAFCNALSDEEHLTKVYAISGESYNPAGNIIAATVTATFANNGYRLPTETEWEYACRGSYANKATETDTKPFGLGDGTKMEYGLANFDTHFPYDVAQGGEYNDPAGPGYKDSTSEVGSYGANNYGLYDMHGNVWEWCWDWHNNALPTNPPKDYEGPASSPSSSRLARGGAYGPAKNLRSAHRQFSIDPSYAYKDTGFRVVRR